MERKMNIYLINSHQFLELRDLLVLKCNNPLMFYDRTVSHILYMFTEIHVKTSAYCPLIYVRLQNKKSQSQIPEQP